MNIPEKVPNYLIMAIMIHIYVGWGFLYLVRLAVQHLSNNAYIGLSIAFIFILPFFWIASDLANIFPTKNIFAIILQVFGKILGTVLNIIYLSILFFFVTVSFKDGNLMIYSYFFTRTSFFLISVSFLMGALYVALKGIHSLSRLAGFMLIPPLLVIFILELLGLSNVNILNIQPVLAGSWRQWLAAGLDSTLNMLPSTTVFFYMPYLKRPKDLTKISVAALMIVFPIFFLGLLGTVGVFGPSFIEKINWSVVEFFHNIDFPYLLLEQAGLFFLISWYGIFFVALSQGIFYVGEGLKTVFTKIKGTWSFIGVGILICATINLPANIINLQSFLMKYNIWFSISFLSLFLCTWIVARLRFKNFKR